MTVEKGIFILGCSFEEICYSQLVKIIFPAIFGVCVGGGAVRWRKCLELVSLCKAPLERHLQEAAWTVLPPLPKKSVSPPACRPSGQLCLALGLMSWRWAAGHLSMEGEQKSSTAGKAAEDLGEILQIIWRGATLICMKCFAVNF